MYFKLEHVFFLKEVSSQSSLSCEPDNNKMCFAQERYEEPKLSHVLGNLIIPFEIKYCFFSQVFYWNRITAILHSCYLGINATQLNLDTWVSHHCRLSCHGSELRTNSPIYPHYCICKGGGVTLWTTWASTKISRYHWWSCPTEDTKLFVSTNAENKTFLSFWTQQPLHGLIVPQWKCALHSVHSSQVCGVEVKSFFQKHPSQNHMWKW